MGGRKTGPGRGLLLCPAKKNLITRRDFLYQLGLSGLALGIASNRASAASLSTPFFPAEAYRALPVLGLATSLAEEYTYAPEIEGVMPLGLEGTLYRNGPGLFERDNQRKKCLLDGDGMVQAFTLQGGRVAYRNRFVRTAKYVEETAAGHYLHATWSTRAPGGTLANLGGGSFANQAGITVVVRDGRLYAFDEFQPPYELDPDTLATQGVSRLGLPAAEAFFSAHSKMDPGNGDWIFFNLEHGRRTRLHLTTLAGDGSPRRRQSVQLPRFAYVHDFFVTPGHIIVNLHPVEIEAWNFLLGRKSMARALQWRPRLGNLILVFDRQGGRPPVTLEAEACWMWHSLNAHERQGEIIADFVGYTDPDHFLGKDPALFAIMEGRQGTYASPGRLRRYIIDPARHSLREEVLDDGNFEFPVVNPRLVGQPYRFGYLATITGSDDFFTGISRVDMVSGKRETFDFGPAVYCSEPVFAPHPRAGQGLAAGAEPGWLLTQVYDGIKRKSFLAVFDAGNLNAGPLARAHLRHHVPLGFHGFWQERG
jgi:all-trans-8'-apo-beta-carotenal 15,15'-oxygenase